MSVGLGWTGLDWAGLAQPSPVQLSSPAQLTEEEIMKILFHHNVVFGCKTSSVSVEY